MATVAEALAIAIKYHQAGRLQDAEQFYRQILQVEPKHPDALHLLGVLFCALGKPEIAAQYMRRAVQVKPDFAQAHYNLGIALKEQGKLEDAMGCFQRAVAEKPDYAEAHNNLGMALSELGKPDEAAACFRRALALKPDGADTHYNLGNALSDEGQLDEATACYKQALSLKPGHAAAHYNLGNALKELGKWDEAVACYHRALALKPDYPEAYTNLGAALNERGDLDEAAACYERALALKPDHAHAHWNQSLLRLLTGDWGRGWAEYEWRWQTEQQNSQRRSFAQPLWDGRPLAGRTILLHAEQGHGDTIQFVRYVSLVKELGGKVVLECQPLLVPLVAGFPGVDQLVAYGDPLPAFEVQAPLLSLPGILGTTLDNIPACIPYLQADPEVVAAWRTKLAALDGFKVGIVWQGNPKVRGDRQRSIPLRYYEALARVKGVRLVSLQKGPAAEQVHTAPFAVMNLGEQLETFRDTAAVLKNLDLLISSCTSVPHLAGALGVPVWLALPFIPDWRWLLQREDSPWYPHHRLFRQARPGDWSEVFERIASALAVLVARKQGTA